MSAAGFEPVIVEAVLWGLELLHSAYLSNFIIEKQNRYAILQKLLLLVNIQARLQEFVDPCLKDIKCCCVLILVGIELVLPSLDGLTEHAALAGEHFCFIHRT